MRQKLRSGVLVAAVAAVGAITASGDNAEAAGTIQVAIKGVKNNTGRLSVALYRDAPGFPEDASKALRAVDAPAAVNGQATLVFDKLPAGVYAIAVQHDENGNGKLDKNALGIPTEGWGVSNNAKPMFRAPKFHEAKFDFDGKSRVVEIKLNY